MSVRKRTWKTAKGEEKSSWIVDYADQSGKRHIQTFKLKKDADKFEASVRVAVHRGEHVAESETVTIEEASEMWLASGRAAGLERTTLDQYGQHVKFHIAPFIGQEKLTKVTVPFVRAFQDRLRDDGRSPAMVKRVTGSLGSILSEAQERGLVARNAVREMSSRRARGKASQAEKRRRRKVTVGVDFPTREDVRKIIDGANPKWRPLLATAALTGLRASELRGLLWDDVDLKSGLLHVRRRADRYQTVGMPKTDAGQRKVPLSPMIVNVLKEWRLACPRLNGELHYVFPSGAGNIEYHSNIVKRGFIPTQIAAGVVNDDGAKYTGLHSLRHFYASWCINRRIDGGLELPPKIVQERLGHSSIQMTMDVYGHLFPSQDDGATLAAAERDLLMSAT